MDDTSSFRILEKTHSRTITVRGSKRIKKKKQIILYDELSDLTSTEMELHERKPILKSWLCAT